MNATDIRTFLTAGRAVFTLTSSRTGTSFTYKIKQGEPMGSRPGMLFASVLTGPDNTADYTYMGVIYVSGPYLECRQTARSRIAVDSPSFDALNWFFRHIGDARVQFRHEGRCGRCGRALTVPSSIDSGLGPECAGKV
jgi:hypothetical protein